MAQDQCKPIGWATQGGGVTGGGNATPTVVSNYADLKSALSDKNVKVVYVSGVITFPLNGRLTIQDTDGKTVIGLAGSRMISVDKTSTGSGILYVKRTSNLILRNLTFEGPGAYDVNGNDNLTFDGVQNAWVDHCDFQDALDGNFDIKNATDYLAVTWCKFSYNKPPIAGGSGGANDHRFSDLVGSSDTETQDVGKLRITFQYCWWSQGCVERMPRVRFGKIHIANCYYNSTVSNTCIRAGYQADLFIESNVFVGVKNPIDLYQNNFTAVTERNNIFTNTSGGKSGSGTSFTPPYSLTIAPASTVQSLVTNTSCGSGATMDNPIQCGCVAQTININPTVNLTASNLGSTACIGTAITISATAQDSDGSISKVDFYNGSTLLGSDNTPPYSISYTPTASGTLSIKATAIDNLDGTGSSSVNTITILALPTASITTTTPTAFCSGGSLVLTTSTGSSYKWFNGTTQVGTSVAYTATAAGNYTVEATNTNGCKATSAATRVTVNASPSEPVVIATVTYCQNGTASPLSATGSGLLWYTTATGGTGTTTAPIPVTTNNGTTNYYVSQTTTGCESPRAMIAVIVNASPLAIITSGSSTNIPQGGSVVLTASTGTSYKWFKGSTQIGSNISYTATAPGAYSVEVTNANNCSATSLATNVNINSNQPSFITITSPTNNSTVKGAITITATVTDSDGSIVLVEYLDGNTVIGTSTSAPYSFIWNAPTANDHVITIRVTDSNGGITTSAPVTVTSEVAITTTGLYSNNSNILNGVVYPNPANGAVYINSDYDLIDASFMLVDVLGNEHIVSHTATGLGAQIDVSNLSSGTYVLIIKIDSSVMRNKITVMK